MKFYSSNSYHGPSTNHNHTVHQSRPLADLPLPVQTEIACGILVATAETGTAAVQVSRVLQGLQTEVHAAATRTDSHGRAAIRMRRVRQTVPTAEPSDATPAHPCGREAVPVLSLRQEFPAKSDTEPTCPDSLGYFTGNRF